MPLHPRAPSLIRQQLLDIAAGRHVSIIVIGELTGEQHRAFRGFRSARGLDGGESPEIVYLGRHHYISRTRQGYLLDDLVNQIASALASDALPFLRGSMTALHAARDRADGYGCMVRDMAVFELSARKPRVELYSVIPKGDRR